MTKLFSPLTIKDVTLKNRLVVSPMCQYSSTDGFANDWHLVHLGSRAVGGAGLIITEATAVSPEGRISPWDLGMWKDEHLDFLKRIVQFIKEQNCVAGIQLAHAGRKASTRQPWKGNSFIPIQEGGWQTVAPSSIPFDSSYGTPVELDKIGIAKVIDDFAQAAKRSLAAGFKVIEVHAAHGYLLHQFLSPISNKREDEYGGSQENRMRLLVEVITAIQQYWPASLPLFVRLSATDYTDGGLTIEDTIEIAGKLKTLGVDLIDCSSGGNVPKAKIEVYPGYQVQYAEAVRKQANIMTGAVGLITSAEQAEQILQNEKADLILMAREMLRNPNFPLMAAHQLDEEITWPVQYERAKPRKK